MPLYTGNIRFQLEMTDDYGAIVVVNLVDDAGVVLLGWPVTALPKGGFLDLGIVTIDTAGNLTKGWHKPPPGTIHRSLTSEVAVNPPPHS